MELKTTNKQIIPDTNYGCYVWELPDGSILGDGEHYMLVFGTANDRAALKAITDAARHYGFPEGHPVFWQDLRPVSDEDHEHQLDREAQGLIPDPFDMGAIRDEMESLKRGY